MEAKPLVPAALYVLMSTKDQQYSSTNIRGYALQTLAQTRVLAGETELYEIMMRHCNQRLYRVARAILWNDAEAEDVMQDAYVRASTRMPRTCRV